MLSVKHLKNPAAAVRAPADATRTKGFDSRTANVSTMLPAHQHGCAAGSSSGTVPMGVMPGGITRTIGVRVDVDHAGLLRADVPAARDEGAVRAGSDRVDPPVLGEVPRPRDSWTEDHRAVLSSGHHVKA